MNYSKGLVRGLTLVSLALVIVSCTKSPDGEIGVSNIPPEVKPLKTTQVATDGRYVNPLSAPANQVYYFDFDQSTVSEQDMAALLIQATYLATHPSASIRLEGNTDNRGSREYNVGLGWRRDQAVARILEQQGVKPSQIQMISYGSERPARWGNTPRDWSLNRRVKLIYKTK